METAPFHADLARGPGGGAAVWLRADDGLRIRAGHWAGDGTGTVFLFPGRCEYVEKYGLAAAELAARGYDAVALDWRGQGLSDRLLRNPDIGHVRRFTDYQKDVDALLGFARARGLPRPWFVIGHSMGGAIGLRALMERAPFAAAAFSAPMWGIVIAPNLRHVARTLPFAARRLGFGGRQAPTTNGADYFLTAPFEGNFLTTDREMWDYMKAQATAIPRFRLGGPSLTWLAEALIETRALHVLPKPDVPCHASVGTLEKIVDSDAIARLAADWSSCSFALVEGAEHELLMERPEVRTSFLDRAMETFARAPVSA